MRPATPKSWQERYQDTAVSEGSRMRESDRQGGEECQHQERCMVSRWKDWCNG